MEENELKLRERIEKLLEIYTFEDILEHNDATIEDILIFLYYEYGLKFPPMELI